jgi:hypothetical protein
LNQVVAGLPEDASSWLERGKAYAERGRWKNAAADLAHAVALKPADSLLWYHLAVTKLQAGDLPGYQQVCAGMQARFGPASWPMRVCWGPMRCRTPPTWCAWPGSA